MQGDKATRRKITRRKITRRKITRHRATYIILCLMTWSVNGLISEKPAIATSSPSFIRPPSTCPSELDTLMPIVLRDIPSYANRVSTRAQVRDRSFNPRGVVLVAAQADTGSLDPDPIHFPTIPSAEAIAANAVTPLFFTTLERHYHDDGAVRIQHYHWVFLSRVEERWYLSSMFSRIGNYPDSSLVSPPRESRQGTIGQGLQLWLRDCNAGAIAPLEDDTPTTPQPD